MKPLLISIIFILGFSSNMYSQISYDTTFLHRELDFDSLDIGIGADFNFPSSKIYRKYKKKIKDAKKDGFLFKLEFRNKKEVLYAYISRYTIINGVEVTNAQKSKNRKYIELKNKSFITNHFKIKLGDQYDAVLTKLSGLPFQKEEINQDQMIRLTGLIKKTSKYEFFVSNASYEAVYKFKNKRLTYFKIMFN